ncbi:hypothetical protein MLD38_010060 [Melastoma candidum]|uniref:Uncharacterized protein n=1 Tax=Melastoma candidum TaxID=119954 RepID=A0ACB9QYS4_9MYRT|nr:hypothetical protein MLD38_010060 [Melastoma candidum]
MICPKGVCRGLIVKVSLCFVTFFCIAVSGYPNVTVLGLACNQGADASESWRHVKFSVRSTLIEFTPRFLGNYYMSASDETLTCYGHATCKMVLSNDDCVFCLQMADLTITRRCGVAAVGGQATLEDCHLRYENYRFDEG